MTRRCRRATTDVNWEIHGGETLAARYAEHRRVTPQRREPRYGVHRRISEPISSVDLVLATEAEHLMWLCGSVHIWQLTYVAGLRSWR